MSESERVETSDPGESEETTAVAESENETAVDAAADEAAESESSVADDSAPEVEEGEDEADEAGCLLPLAGVVEAVLIGARHALTPKQIARCVGKGTRVDAVRAVIDELNAHYLEAGRAFEIVETAGKFQFMTRPEYAPHLQKLYGGSKKKDERKLSPAALDTLSIIAYKQPLTRVEVETVRGVNCGPVLRGLIERGSVRVVGKKTDVVGQPLLYGTTPAFLEEFGLASLEMLPMLHELRQATGTEEPLPEEGGEVQLTVLDGDDDADEEDEIDDEIEDEDDEEEDEDDGEEDEGDGEEDEDD